MSIQNTRKKMCLYLLFLKHYFLHSFCLGILPFVKCLPKLKNEEAAKVNLSNGQGSDNPIYLTRFGNGGPNHTTG